MGKLFERGMSAAEHRERLIEVGVLTGRVLMRRVVSATPNPLVRFDTDIRSMLDAFRPTWLVYEHWQGTATRTGDDRLIAPATHGSALLVSPEGLLIAHQKDHPVEGRKIIAPAHLTERMLTGFDDEVELENYSSVSRAARAFGSGEVAMQLVEFIDELGIEDEIIASER
ncbi:MAG TPA: hypothetical protein VLF91_06365 [Candidatus Saccharimonadales bacterium]|nr:hypothetical protein [Candidatus Saccharimonadales bacterium]